MALRRDERYRDVLFFSLDSFPCMALAMVGLDLALVHPSGRGEYLIVSSQENTVVPESSQCLA